MELLLCFASLVPCRQLAAKPTKEGTSVQCAIPVDVQVPAIELAFYNRRGCISNVQFSFLLCRRLF